MILGGRTLRRVLVAFVALLVAATAAEARTPGPDHTFGGDGVVVDRKVGRDVTASAVAVQPNGRVVVAGSDFRSGTPGTERWVLVRYLRDGRRDPSFGTRGVVRTSFGAQTFDTVGAVALQRDGRIVVVGHTFSLADQSEAVVVARYRRDGSLDPTFADGGTALLSAGTGGGEARDVALTSDGSIVVVGTVDQRLFVMQVTPDGELDSDFNGDGLAYRSVAPGGPRAEAVAVQENGRVVVAGSFRRGARLVLFAARFTRAGQPDDGFGRAGVARVPAPRHRSGYVRDLAIQPDGRLVIVGGTHGGTDHSPGQVLLARLTYRGVLDHSFGGTGTVTVGFGRNPQPTTVLARRNGRLVVGATSDRRFGLMRLLPDGRLDGSFGGTGRVTVAAGGVGTVSALAGGRGGQLVVVGRTLTPTPSLAVLAYQP